MTISRWSPVLAAWIVAMAGNAQAAEPRPWEIFMQPAATPVMERITSFNELLLVIEGVIVLFVLALMLIIFVRFRASRNPVPSKTTHNPMLEVIWTVVPILILVVIAVPSMRLLFYMDKVPTHGPEAKDYPEMTLKITGHQWYWSYQYPDYGEFEFDSNIVPEDELKPGQLRLLEVDNHVVLPVNTNVRLLMTSGDVIHDWAVPSFGIKMDAVPGRINETWIRINDKGTYYGQCSELCGVNHGFMPIVVDAVSKKDFDAWVAKAKKENADEGTEPASRLAANVTPR
jgi:cytochrome c oxidase subunit 2